MSNIKTITRVPDPTTKIITLDMEIGRASCRERVSPV